MSGFYQFFPVYTSFTCFYQFLPISHGKTGKKVGEVFPDQPCLWIKNSVKLWDVNRTHDAPSGVLWNYRLYMSAGVSCAQARRREGCAAL